VLDAELLAAIASDSKFLLNKDLEPFTVKLPAHRPKRALK